MPILKIKELSIGYANTIIASDINAELKDGELTCLLGPNGSGKSTILRTIANMQKALGGDIFIKDKKINEINRKEFSTLVSIVLTHNEIDQDLTAEDVISFGRSPYTGFWGKMREKDIDIIKKTINEFELEEIKDRKIGTLSDGEQQKVLTAKAMVQDTPIILLDEPTSHLDFPSKVQTMLKLKKIAHQQKKAILLSTHDVELALQIADRIWLIGKNKPLVTGVAEDLGKDGKMEEYFGQKGIIFAEDNCSFVFEHETTKEISITGDRNSILYKLCIKAMLRNGIKPIHNRQTEMSLVVKDGKIWTAYKGEIFVWADDIETAIESLE